MKVGIHQFPFLPYADKVQPNYEGLETDEEKNDEALRVRKINKALNKSNKLTQKVRIRENSAVSQQTYRDRLSPEEKEEYKAKARERAEKSRRLAKQLVGSGIRPSHSKRSGKSKPIPVDWIAPIVYANRPMKKKTRLSFEGRRNAYRKCD